MSNAEFWYHYENCDYLDFGDVDHEYENICYYATNSFVTSDDYYDSFLQPTEGSFESILEKGSFLAEQKVLSLLDWRQNRDIKGFPHHVFVKWY